MLSIIRRDLATYFNSAMAWILSAVYLFLTGIIFILMLSSFNDRSATAGMPQMGGGNPNVMNDVVVPYVWWMGFLLMFIVPMLTMRLFAEERRTGTLETLFTYPLSDLDIVLGKFTAALGLVTVMLGLGYSSVIALSQKVALDWSSTGLGFCGLLLVASAFISFGLWASSLTASQVVAAAVTYGGLMLMWLVEVLERDTLAPVKEKLGGLSVMEHLERLVRGNVTTHDLLYYVAWTGLFLFLTCRVLDSRKWSS